MVVLTIVAQKNGETIFFNDPFPKVHFIRLVSCSLYNSWHNLTRVGLMTFKKPNGSSNVTLASIPEGHYTIESIAKELKTSIDSFNKSGTLKLEFKIETNKPNSVLKISGIHIFKNFLKNFISTNKFFFGKKLY